MPQGALAAITASLAFLRLRPSVWASPILVLRASHSQQVLSKYARRLADLTQLQEGEAAQAGTPRTWSSLSPPLLSGLHLSTSEKIFRFQDTGLLLRVLGSLFLGGILAFGLGFSEFLLVSRTSSLTLSIAGIFKVQTQG